MGVSEATEDSAQLDLNSTTSQVENSNIVIF